MTLQVSLPFAVDSEGARSELDAGKCSLRVVLPFRPFKDVLAEVCLAPFFKVEVLIFKASGLSI